MNLVKELPTNWQEQWQKLGFTEPTSIQKESFPLLKDKKSVVGISPTGSGKTLAYLLPLLLNIQKGTGAQLVILLPSQELAVQVAQVAQVWGQLLDLKVQSIIGGANVKRQVEKLKQKPEILVATPGRLLELIKIKKVKPHLIQTLVLDEVDHLLTGQGQEQTVTQEVVKTFPRDIQVVCVSATAHQVLNKIEQLFSNDFTVLDVRQEDTSTTNLHHAYIQVPKRKRSDILRRLAYVPDFRAIVFFNQLEELGLVSDKLNYEHVPHVTLASDQSKIERKRSIELFSEQKVPFLLTTDIAARGLDFQELTYIIQYDPTISMDSYVHRSGRIGRMGREGMVITLANEMDVTDLKKVCKKLQVDLDEVFVYEGKLWLEKPEELVAENILKGKKIGNKAKKKDKKSQNSEKSLPKKKRKK